MGLIFAKLCFLCMDTYRRGRELRAIQHKNGGEMNNSKNSFMCVCVFAAVVGSAVAFFLNGASSL